jgi:hypothetical protein
VRATDAGSGVDPRSLRATVDGDTRQARLLDGDLIRIAPGRLAPGRHRLVLDVSDYQETRNMENEPRILPNTAKLSVVFRVR